MESAFGPSAPTKDCQLFWKRRELIPDVTVIYIILGQEEKSKH